MKPMSIDTPQTLNAALNTSTLEEALKRKREKLKTDKLQNEVDPKLEGEPLEEK